MTDRVYPDSAWKVPAQEYLARRGIPEVEGHTLTSQYVKMSDGCLLAVDIFLPVAIGSPPGSFPTLVIFTPYTRRFAVTGKEPGPERSPNTAVYRDFFVRHGYALVVVDMRGTGASFGTRYALRSPHERDDACEIAQWIVGQSWSNGVIGSTGISYLGAAACFLASTGHPAVKAIAPMFSVSDIYSEQLFPGGMLSRVWSRQYDELMTALDQNDREKIKAFPYWSDERLAGPQPVDEDAAGALLREAMRQHEDNFRLHDLMPEWRFRGEGPLNDPALTTDVCSPFAYLKDGIAPDVAVYSISGWYDGGGYANGAITRYLTLKGAKDRLLLGPWDHGARTHISPWRTAIRPSFPMMSELLRFFDQHLMGIETGLNDEAPIHYFSIHDERWKSSLQWPPTDKLRTFHLANDQTLQESASLDSGEAVYQVRHATTTGSATRWARLGGQKVESYYDDWSARVEDLFNFRTDILHEALSITGHIIVDLWVTSSEQDFGIFVYASEIEADGTVRYITEGMLRALHRKTSDPPANYVTSWPYRTYRRTDSRSVTPDQMCSVVIPLLPISWTLQPGSRLMLSVAGADSENFPQVSHGRPPLLGIACGGTYSSKIVLPVEPATDGNTL